VIPGHSCAQDTERPTSQLVSQLTLACTSTLSTSHPPPGTSPRNLSSHAATMLDFQTRSPSHELENLQGEIVHGETHVTSVVTSLSRNRSPHSQTQGHFHSNSSQCLPSSSQVSADLQALRIHPPSLDNPYATPERRV
jgi:hypothetical protein